MKANESYIHRFLDGADKKFIVPVYQRPYSWKKENCELLFSDLMTVYRKGYTSHFFGGIVYVANEVAGCNEYIIIDGQQRITTISILLLAIRNYISANNIDIDINTRKITNAYLTDEYADEEKKLKLKLVQGDDQAYDKLIRGQKPIENNVVTINYNYFYTQIGKLESEEIKGLYDAILKLMIVNISLNPANGDDPQLIFESLNSTGLGLEEADKIRNYVLMNMSAKDQEKFYKEYWETLEDLVSRSDMNKFIRYYLAAKNNELANEKKLYFAFKNYKLYNEIDSIELLEDMLQYAEWYDEIKNAKPYATNYQAVLARLNKLEMNSSIPLLFHLFKANRNEELSFEELEKCFVMVEAYIVRRAICGLQTNQLNKVFVGLGYEINKYVEKDEIPYYEAFEYALLAKTGKSRFPNNHDFEDKFSSYEVYNARPAMKKYLLERLENHGTRERIAVEEQVDSGVLTIEHIMPQTLTTEWKTELGDGWELTHTKYKDTFGNITLTAYNSDYSNFSFLKKKEMPSKGFDCSKLELNKYVKGCTVWNEQTIIERASILYRAAKEIWWIPESKYTPQDEEQWIDWEDEFEFTNKVITKIKFMGDEIVTKDITDVYKKINTMLYELDPATYLEIKDCTYSSKKTDFRTATEIGKEMYLEGNISSSVKMTVLAKVIEGFGLDNQDVQYLVKNKKTAVAFDISDEKTFDSLKVGKLAYELFNELIKQNKITGEEIELLKDKGYTKELFERTDYPAIANNREDNRGGGSTIRYRKEPLVFEGESIFITTQWFEGNREDLVKWYKKHLENS